MTGYIDCHRKLEPEHPLRIKVAQSYEQTESATSIGQLIQHGSKLRR